MVDIWLCRWTSRYPFFPVPYSKREQAGGYLSCARKESRTRVNVKSTGSVVDELAHKYWDPLEVKDVSGLGRQATQTSGVGDR